MSVNKLIIFAITVLQLTFFYFYMNQYDKN